MQALVVTHHPRPHHIKAGDNGDDEKGKVQDQLPVEGKEGEKGGVQANFSL